MTTEAQLRSSIRTERRAIAALEAKIKDPYVRRLLRNASSGLDMVELGFLSKEVMREPRSPAQLTRWLHGAERFLRIAIQQRKHVDGIVDKFGYDVRSFGA
jgi:hypothetical protein